MGKNTQIRRVFRQLAEENPDLSKMIPLIQGNVGMVFTNDDIIDVRDILVSVKVPAAAKAGAFAPCDVVVPAGPTGLDPGQTSFFQSMGISTKIMRGSIEIVSSVPLIKAGDKVGLSEVELLSKLNIRPFSYGFRVTKVYDSGAVYDSAVLDMSESDLKMKFAFAVSRVAAIGLEIGYPCLATLPHSVSNAFKKLVAICSETGYSFPAAEPLLAYLADPSAFVVAAAPAEGAAPEAAAVEESEEDSDEEIGGGGLFGDSDSDSDDSDSD